MDLSKGYVTSIEKTRGGGALGLIFAGYVPLASQSPYPIIVYSVANYTAISRKVVGKSARDNPKRYCGWFWVHFSSKKFERMALEAMDICLRVLEESTTYTFDSYNRQEQRYWSYPMLPFGIVACTFFSDNLSRYSCIPHLSHFWANM